MVLLGAKVFFSHISFIGIPCFKLETHMIRPVFEMCFTVIPDLNCLEDPKTCWVSGIWGMISDRYWIVFVEKIWCNIYGTHYRLCINWCWKQKNTLNQSLPWFFSEIDALANKVSLVKVRWKMVILNDPMRISHRTFKMCQAKWRKRSHQRTGPWRACKKDVAVVRNGFRIVYDVFRVHCLKKPKEDIYNHPLLHD